MMAVKSPRKPKPTSKTRASAVGKASVELHRSATTGPSGVSKRPLRRFVRIVARNRVGGRPASDRFVLVCALEDDRIVDGEWFGKQVYPEDEGGEFAIIVREGREIHYPAGYWRTNIGTKRMIPGELFSVFGDEDAESRSDGEDVWEITNVSTF